MRKRLLALVGASLAMGALSGACGGDDTKSTVVSPATFSSEGESCARTGDCKAGLVCLTNRCVNADGGIVKTDSGSPSTGTGGTTTIPTGTGGTTIVDTGTGGTVVPTTDGGVPEASPGSGGTTTTTTTDASVPTPVRLSGENQSCARTADCETGLVCIAQTCMKGAPVATPDGGEAGTPVTPAPRLGGVGETCMSVTDCQTDLVCVPVGTYALIGSCQLKDYNIDPSGKGCYECKEDKDCCELPLGLSITLGPAQTVQSCQDIINALVDDGGGTEAAPDTNCAAATGALGNACFYYATYCKCKEGLNNPWKCGATDHKCTYNGVCSVTRASGEIMGSCPALTRAHYGVPDCDVEGTTKCTGAPTGCDPTSSTTSDPCFDGTDLNEVAGPFPPADHSGDPPCSKGECACSSNQCLRKCSRDLDCPTGSVCKAAPTGTIPAGSKLCQTVAECTADADCPVRSGNVKAKCINSRCEDGCTTDRDCSPSGLPGTSGTFTGYVCSSKGICEEVGCSTDDQCSITSGNTTVRAFCLTKPTTPAAAAGTWGSAITY